MNIPAPIRETAQVMAWALERERLTVTLAPSCLPDIARQGGKIRVVAEVNPGWYQQFCDDHAPSRRARLRRKKKRTLSSNASTPFAPSTNSQPAAVGQSTPSAYYPMSKASTGCFVSGMEI